jgi:hypothetical protein
MSLGGAAVERLVNEAIEEERHREQPDDYKTA